MPHKALTIIFCATIVLRAGLFGQGVQPYPKATTDRLLHQKTAMAPPPKNVVFADRDFGSLMVRVTDPSTNFKLPTALRTEASGKMNEWSVDSKKFYVTGNKGGQVLGFGFDPSTMSIQSLPGAQPGQGLLLPLRSEPTFSFVDPDLIYGVTNRDTLTISSYRFSTGVSTQIINTRTCGLQPALGPYPPVTSDGGVNLSLNDQRISLAEGGPQSGEHMFVVVYDKTLGCRWYNTQTGQIGGQWGMKGRATVTTPYLIRHAFISGNGKYVTIAVNFFGWYVWDLKTLSVTSCANVSSMKCEGYGANGYKAHVNGPAVLDDMETVIRPLSNLSHITPLYFPIPSPHNWGQVQHFTWSNVNTTDSTPVCGSTYNYEGDESIDQPYAGEIFCIETDGLASTIWRFAHNHATWINPYFNTQPLANISRDGHFFLFTSDWDKQLGLAADGTPDSAVFIVKLE